MLEVISWLFGCFNPMNLVIISNKKNFFIMSETDRGSAPDNHFIVQKKGESEWFRKMEESE